MTKCIAMKKTANNALVRTQTTLHFVCAAQLGRYALRHTPKGDVNEN